MGKELRYSDALVAQSRFFSKISLRIPGVRPYFLVLACFTVLLQLALTQLQSFDTLDRVRIGFPSPQINSSRQNRPCNHLLNPSEPAGLPKIPFPASLLRLSLPAMVGMMTQGAYYFVDRVFVGQALNPDALAGITMAFPYMLVLLAACDADWFWRRGAGIDQAGREEDRRGRAGSGQRRAAALAIFRFSHGRRAGCCWTRSCAALGISAAVLPYTHDYLQIVIFATGFQLVGFGLNAVIRAEGNARTAMWTLLIGVFLNFVLAWLFLFNFHWGMRGGGVGHGNRPGRVGRVGAGLLSQGKSLLRLHWRSTCGSTARRVAGSC